MRDEAVRASVSRPVTSLRVGPAEFPYRRKFLIVGLCAGAVVALLFWSALAGFSFLMVFLCAGMVWRRGEPPLLPFCLAYQWVFIVSGFLYMRMTGVYPGDQLLGNLEAAILISLLGLLVLATGLVLGRRVAESHILSIISKPSVSEGTYAVRKLFWCVIGLFAVNWIFDVAPMQVAFNSAQILYRLLEFRVVFLFLLLYTVIRHRHGYRYGVAAFLFAWIPTLGSFHSRFLQPFIVLLMAFFAAGRSWRSLDLRRIGPGRLLPAFLTLILLTWMALVWQGGVKDAWREAVRSDAVPREPVEKMLAFVGLVAREAPQIDVRAAVESLVGRTSSGAAYFSLVLERVPSLIPHENGTLTLRALKHLVTPRFLFPEKPNLGGDSWLVRTYAGLSVAGDEENTSVGLGYMAELFIDYGVPWMFLGLLAYGILAGLLYQSCSLVSPSRAFFSGVVVVIFLEHFVSYEGELAKLLGGLVQAFLVFSVTLHFAGRRAHRMLSTESAAYLLRAMVRYPRA